MGTCGCTEGTYDGGNTKRNIDEQNLIKNDNKTGNSSFIESAFSDTIFIYAILPPTCDVEKLEINETKYTIILLKIKKQIN